MNSTDINPNVPITLTDLGQECELGVGSVEQVGKGEKVHNKISDNIYLRLQKDKEFTSH
jgi:hypothetical protein